MAQHTATKNVAKAESLGKKPLTFTVSFSSVITMCMVLVGGIAWAFFMGVIVGRGENPHATMPELSTLLKEEGEGGANVASVVEDSTANGVVQPEDLHYAASLKGKSPAKVNQGVTLAQTASAPSSEVKTNTAPEAVAPEIATSETTTQAQSSQGAVSSTQAVAAEQELPTPVKPLVFDYVFQVATFNNTESVDILRAELEGIGLRTRMDKVGKFYMVMVLMRGTEAQAQELRQRMLKMRLGEPLQRGKTPVT